ncbi:hypothetical protein BOX15_Mlig034117g2 [Macrostomum lignano]|uniref:BTB domain-containing protein n=2 Tax=Macrostomum lignano TaxID=282301 RepID=A0A267GTC0_9PLAT|nr:hypothetical protein BOX15_Mlig034117g2 [Macrostomum lignano]
MSSFDSTSGLVIFNVGGRRHQVFLQTLAPWPESLLCRLARGQLRSIADSDGAVCIDRDPDTFGLVLNFLRYRRSPLDIESVGSAKFHLLLEDSDFYCLPELRNCLLQLRETAESAETAKASSTEANISLESCADEQSSLITLDVGGTRYSTSLSTLTRYPDSMLGAMFSDRFRLNNPAAIDRDGNLFRHVLNFLRNGRLSLPDGFSEGEALLAEAEFYQIQPLVQQLRDWLGGYAASRAKGVYLEVKDNVVCFRGFHITTSLTGPLAYLKSVPPFDTELARLTQPAPMLSQFCAPLPFYTAWVKGSMEEVYLNSDASKSRLEWASLLRATGWRLCSTSSCCSSSSDQTFIVVDKWFLPSEQLYNSIFLQGGDGAGQQQSMG